MRCEICGEQTATMWVQDHKVSDEAIDKGTRLVTTLEWTGVSCDDCGPQLGYKTLAPLEPGMAPPNVLVSNQTTPTPERPNTRGE